mmetsp:Transcript_47030/g.73607  ORF Transcript_47030/g.73607 Transcript_47030/m.73607 type:complete len:214 (-) Transcript_47030:70-711(-)
MDGSDAVDLITVQEMEFDLLLLDLKMKVMDGQEAARLIRDFQFKKGLELTPMVAVTASILREDQDLTFEAGMSGWISKPIRMQTVIKTLYDFVELFQSDDSVHRLGSELQGRELGWTVEKLGDMNMFIEEPKVSDRDLLENCLDSRSLPTDRGESDAEDLMDTQDKSTELKELKENGEILVPGPDSGLKNICGPFPEAGRDTPVGYPIGGLAA